MPRVSALACVRGAELAFFGDTLLVTDAAGHVDAVDPTSSTVESWTVLPEDALCIRKHLHILPNDLAYFGGGCVADLETGAQLVIAR